MTKTFDHWRIVISLLHDADDHNLPGAARALASAGDFGRAYLDVKANEMRLWNALKDACYAIPRGERTFPDTGDIWNDPVEYARALVEFHGGHEPVTEEPTDGAWPSLGGDEGGEG